MFSVIGKDIWIEVATFIGPVSTQLVRMTCSHLLSTIVVPRGRRCLLLNAAVSNNYFNLVKWCFDNDLSRDALTCMHCISTSNIEMLKYLLEKKCPIMEGFEMNTAIARGNS